MERQAMAELVRWKDDPKRHPLILRGARQVGKTWLLQEFGARFYQRTIYATLETEGPARHLFDSLLAPSDLIDGLSLLDGRGAIDPDSTLIILDEVQERPLALSALKYFAESPTRYHIVAAGSLLGIALHGGVNFPVGKVSFLDVGPMTFSEFVTALGHGDIMARVTAGQWPVVAPFHEQLVSWLRWYMVVGGMPGIVAAYLLEHDTTRVRLMQSDLLSAYDHDFSKYAPAAEVPALRAVYQSIPRQLARENRRFVFGQVREGARGRHLEASLQWLADAGLAHRVPRVSTPRLPLAAYESPAFKLFGSDVGLLGAMAGLDPIVLIDGNAMFTEFKGSLTEQYVLLELFAAGFRPFYWTNKAGRAEIDFLVEAGGDIVPVEVKAQTNVHAKSLRYYRDTFQPRVSVRTSLLPYQAQDGLINLPLYALGAGRTTLVSAARIATGAGPRARGGRT